MKKSIQIVVACLAFAIIIVVGVSAWVSQTWYIHNNATMKTVGVEVYWDQALTENVASIDWGIFEPGQNKTVRVYIKSVANVPSTLNMSTSNWLPSNASLYITLSWSYNGIVLNPNDVIPVDLTLAASPSITGIKNFSFDITITAQG
jgi:hypothetical protein